MVILGDFKVQLVEADTKQPFPEHFQNGQTYVEVEPGVEYYLSHQRVGISRKQDFILRPTVDGMGLGWQHCYFGVAERDKTPTYCGCCLQTQQGDGDDKTEICALKFAKPQLVEIQDDDYQQVKGIPMLMGKVDFFIHQKGEKRCRKGSTSAFAPLEAMVSRSTPGAAQTKQVRSVSGCKIIRSFAPESYYYTCGALIETITLNYCTVPGLIQVGILPKLEDIYHMHRIITGKKQAASKPPLVPPQRICTSKKVKLRGCEVSNEVSYYDFFDLTGLDDNDNDSDQGEVSYEQDQPAVTSAAQALPGEPVVGKKSCVPAFHTMEI